MPKLRLTDTDRERLGCPEFLPLDLASITNREAIELRRLGWNTPRLFQRALDPGKEETDEGVEYVLNYEAWTALVWLALRRAGVETDPHTLEFDVFGFEYLADVVVDPELEEAEEGKAPAASTSSAPKSSTRGATSRPKSTPTG